jgi:hypothetical protein
MWAVPLVSFAVPLSANEDLLEKVLHVLLSLLHAAHLLAAAVLIRPLLDKPLRSLFAVRVLSKRRARIEEGERGHTEKKNP